MTLDVFNLIAGAVSIIAFIFSIVLYVREKALKGNLEASLLGFIGNMDALVFSCNSQDTSKDELAAMSAMIRNQAIAILKSFSDREERFRTFDFGFTEEEIRERVRRRKEALGIDYGGCIVENQTVETADGGKLVQDITLGGSITSFSFDENSIVQSRVCRTNRHNSKNFIQLNKQLNLTANHLIYVRHKGWLATAEVTIGDEIMSIGGGWDMVRSMESINQQTHVFDVKVADTPNLFVSGYLVHNGKVKHI